MNKDTIVKMGIDVLIEQNFDIINNKNIILLTNQAGINNKGESTLQILKNNSHLFNLKCLFTPEHGYYSFISAGSHVSDDTIFGVPSISLYGKNRKPSKSSLIGCDALVVDLQDIGIRSYTYISTLYNTMQACAELNIPVIVLDRPNPLGGYSVDGNTVEPELKSFVSMLPISYIHGCTIGELANMINQQGWLFDDLLFNKPIKCNLTVIKMKNWYRWMNWEDTGLYWVPTSPNIPTIDAIRGMAMFGIFGELSIFSIGIGTTLPFQFIGSPDFDFQKIKQFCELNNYEGIITIPTKYKPTTGMYAGKECNGILFRYYANNLFTPYSTGIDIVLKFIDLFPSFFNNIKINNDSKKMFNKVTGNSKLLQYIFNKKSKEQVFKEINNGFFEFLEIREKYLLYD